MRSTVSMPDRSPVMRKSYRTARRVRRSAPPRADLRHPDLRGLAGPGPSRVGAGAAMDADVDTSQTVGPDEVARRVGKLTDAAVALAAGTAALRPGTPTPPQ